MKPELTLLGVHLHTFGLACLAAFTVGLVLFQRRLEELGLPARLGTEGAVVATLAGFVGARLYVVLEHPDPLGHVLSTTGGIGWYGGVIGGFAGVAAWTAWRRLSLVRIADALAPSLAWALALGRLGCQLSGDGDYGRPSHLPWAMGYPHGTVPTPPGVRVQPTPLYEFGAMALIGWWLWRHRAAYRPGALIATWVLLAGIERFLLEFLRRNADVAAGLTLPQIFSLLAVAGGGGALLLMRARLGGLASPAAPATT